MLGDLVEGSEGVNVRPGGEQWRGSFYFYIYGLGVRGTLGSGALRAGSHGVFVSATSVSVRLLRIQ